MYDQLERLSKKLNIHLGTDYALHTNMDITDAYRLLLELHYAADLSRYKDHQYDVLVTRAISHAYDAVMIQGAVTRALVQEIEDMLRPLAADAKSYTIMCVGHSHIDMNWMWGLDETVMVIRDTFRTVLDLMQHYPDFTFGQSQASVYYLMAQYFPHMIDEVKQRIREGRWEVTASTWVEADKNMPNGESMARHLLYTRQYLSQLLDIPLDSMDLDFEPDTFGHMANTPAILRDGGVKYYYHCRGYEDEILYRWHADEDTALTVFREPTWYNHTITGHTATLLMDYCAKYNMDTFLCVYGVGDHGGGPTRRDIERIIEMNTWPIFPTWTFGTYKEFYQKTDKIKDTLPKVYGELNFLFMGCYTSQSIIKKNNKQGELALRNTELFNTIAHDTAGSAYQHDGYAVNWQKLLFNQFHDILPGSGVTATREYACGLAQEVFSFTHVGITQAMRDISDHIDLRALLPSEEAMTIAQGAGVGYGLEGSSSAQYARHAGSKRAFTVFNTIPYRRKQLVEVTLWDYGEDDDRLVFMTADGQRLNHQPLTRGINNYWGHAYNTYWVEVTVEALGYTTIIAGRDETYPIPKLTFDEPRVVKIPERVLENARLRAVFDPQMRIISLIDKQSGVDYAGEQPTGLWKLIHENPARGMSAWRMGYPMEEILLNECVKIDKICTGTGLRQHIDFTCVFGNGSELVVQVYLDPDSCRLQYDVTCRWHEIGAKTTSIPQLQFHVPLGYTPKTYAYDIPAGIIQRRALDHDVPALSFAMADAGDGTSLAVMSDCKYGYRGDGKALTIDLIRASYNPDPYPEIRDHQFSLAIALVDDAIGAKKEAESMAQPLLSVSAIGSQGQLPLSGSFIEVLSGDLILSAYKKAETHLNRNILRVFNINPLQKAVKIQFHRPIRKADFVDLNEQIVEGDIAVEGDCISCDMETDRLYSIMIE